MLVAETVSIQLLNFVYWDDDINPLDDAVASPYVVLVVGGVYPRAVVTIDLVILVK